MDNNLIRENSEKKYTYSYGDGTNMTICANMFKEDGRKWIELLVRMDMDEEANNKKESRRHCSFEAFDPEGDTLMSDEKMEDMIVDSEFTTEFIKTLKELEKKVFIGRFMEQLTQDEVAIKLHYTQARMAQIEKEIREKFNEFKKK